jgi:predicted ribosomally synthesized peptide with SipW-like signal peptide
MRKVLLSVLMIGAVGATAFGASRAWFSDTEVSTGNSFTTGTINIDVDGQDPWEEQYALADMKPSQTDYIDFVVHNTGGNPVNLYKTLQSFTFQDIERTESEDEAEAKYPAGEVPELDQAINYDLRVELYNVEPTESVQPVWWETIYTDDDGIKLDSLEGKDMYLGMIPADWYMKVKQSYHMPGEETGNEYQGDQLTFDIKLYAEQLTNHIVLENKYLANTDVSHHVWLPGGVTDNMDATLDYKVKDKEFNFELDVHVPVDGPYTLVAWEDPTYAWTWGSFAGTTVLANVNVSGGTDHIVPTSVELNKNLINAKVWIVPGNLGAPGTKGVSLPWDPTNTLFETGLIDYYDTDVTP